MVQRLQPLKHSLRESLFRNYGVPYRNLIGLLLGFTASFLPLTTHVLGLSTIVVVFLVLLGLTLILLILVRPYVESELDRFAWGLLVIILFGYGLGGLIYQSRAWWIWLWNKYRLISEPYQLVLESLFLLGVMLGVFVVRNWSKEQKDFQASISGILSGTFIAAVLGSVLNELTPMRALAYYALGFTMSGTFNVILAAKLTANYTNKRSITSRAILDFLYGSERAEIIDNYFLKNFKRDPDYARASLTEAMISYRELVSREFAERMEERRKYRKGARQSFEEKKGSITELRKKKSRLEPRCRALHMTIENRNRLQDEIDVIESTPEPRAPKQEQKLLDLRKNLEELDQNVAKQKEKCSPEQLKEWKELENVLTEIKPSYYYELMAIESEEESSETGPKTRTRGNPEQSYVVKYRELDCPDALELKTKEGPPAGAINELMFRVGISARWQDTLEYITAPGEYRMPFKYTGSVAGLALLFRKTIVMDPDKKKRFRNSEFPDGITPEKVEQPRGLDEIDFLSYVALPIVSRLGAPGENPVGIMTIDTKIFVTRSELGGEPVQGTNRVFRMRLSRAQLTEYGANLYDQEDQCVEYIERLTKVIVPVLELYSKCRVGAT